jgi:hypothetical protein
MSEEATGCKPAGNDDGGTAVRTGAAGGATWRKKEARVGSGGRGRWRKPGTDDAKLGLDSVATR